MVLAYLSYLDGLLPIHGSCVSRANSAICVMGRAKAGKSTLAAALVKQGAQFVSDGQTIFDPNSGCACLGLPMRRLWDDALRWLGGDPDRHPTLEQGPPKRVCEVPERERATEPPLLKKIFVVDDAETLGIEPVGPQQSVMEILRHGFLSPWLDAKEAPKVTELSAALARAVPVFRLLRPKRMDALEDTVALLDRELRSLDSI